ncbi:MAG: hypothetical protein L0K86_18345, partial [Actinomycetia bacterium]|nr:hypothetical protein [Actinomycetes bacterium]
MPRGARGLLRVENDEQQMSGLGDLVPFRPMDHDRAVPDGPPRVPGDVEIDPVETGDALSRRRRAVAMTGLVGAALLGAGMTAPTGSGRFYGFTAATAATYIAGALASGPIERGASAGPVRTPAALGVGAFGVFYAGGLVARRIPFARRAISRVLGYAPQGMTPLVVGVTLVNGVAEELYFRGAVYAAAAGRRPVL